MEAKTSSKGRAVYRIVAWALTLALVFTMTPLSATAADTYGSGGVLGEAEQIPLDGAAGAASEGEETGDGIDGGTGGSEGAGGDVSNGDGTGGDPSGDGADPEGGDGTDLGDPEGDTDEGLDLDLDLDVEGGLTAMSGGSLAPLSETGTPNLRWYVDNGGVSGPTSGTFEIQTADDLAGLAQIVNDTATHPDDPTHILLDSFNGKTITLMADIDLSNYGEGVGTWNSGQGWIPIGISVGESFRGTFNGNDKVITGLYINNSSLDNAGLFGYVTGGKVESLGVQGSVTAHDNVGGIVGLVTGSGVAIERSFFAGTVEGLQNIGGVAGRANTGSIVTRSHSEGEVKGRAGSQNIGGVVGQIQSSTIENSYSRSDVSGPAGAYTAGSAGSQDIGGVVGVISSTSQVAGNYSVGSVSGGSTVGGVVGTVYSSTVENNAALNKSVTASVSTAGRVAGSASAGLSGNHAFSGMEITAGGSPVSITEGTGGAIATGVHGLGKNAWELRSASGFPSIMQGPPDGGTTSTPWFYRNLNLPNLVNEPLPMPTHLRFVWVQDTSWYDPTKNELYIYTAAELAGFAWIVNGEAEDSEGNPIAQDNFLGKTVKLAADIDLAYYATAAFNDGKGWLPIGRSLSYDTTDPFSGTFDGQGHTITGLYINDTTLNYAGLFGYLDGATVKNLGVVDADIIASDWIGIIAGMAYGTNGNGSTIEQCYSTGSVTGRSNAGGLVGTVFGPNVVKDSYSMADVLGTSYVGGLVGMMTGGGSVQNSYATGIVEATASEMAGGLVGYAGSGTHVENSMALNRSVITTFTTGVNVGRVIGGGDATLTNNRAFGEMGVFYGPSGASEKPINNGPTTKDGLGTSMQELRAAAGYTTQLRTGAWTYAEPDLPGLFGQTVRMPAHLKAPSTGTPDYKWYIDAGTAAPVYEIWSADELAGFAALVNNGYYTGVDDNWTSVPLPSGTVRTNFADKLVKLMDHIDLGLYGENAGIYNNGVGWLPISENSMVTSDSLKFAGTFDGGGKEITGLYSVSDNSYKGLFGHVRRATIRNVAAVDVNISGRSYIGGIVAYANWSTVESCYVTGKVTGSGTMSSQGYNVGGIVGNLGYAATSPGTVKDCYSLADVTGVNYVGGVVGQASDNSVVRDSYATGKVFATSPSAIGRAGGIVGAAISSSTVIGNIALNESVVIRPNDSDELGRVIGYVYAGPGTVISGNRAFDRMYIRRNAGADGTGGIVKDPLDTSDSGKDGEGQSKARLHTYAGFQNAFLQDPPWAHKEGDLPGLFGKTVPMPEWLKFDIPVTVNVNLDDQPWNGVSENVAKTYTLVPADGGATVPLTMTSTGVFTGMASEGTWEVYDTSTGTGVGTATGVEITITSSVGNTAALDYYTIEFSVAPAGLTDKASISAKYNDTPITSGDIVLSGGDLELEVYGVEGPDHTDYTYAWSVNGIPDDMHDEDDPEYTVSFVDGTTVVVATVNGTSPALYTASVTVNLDGIGQAGRIVQLRTVDTPWVFTTMGHTADGVYTASVPDDTYLIFTNMIPTSTDTNRTLVINGDAAAATVDYYTVTYDWVNGGSAAGSEITATYNGTSISTGTVVLGGGTLALTVTPGGQPPHEYDWSVDTGSGPVPVPGSDSPTHTVNPVNAKTDVQVIVRGTQSTIDIDWYLDGNDPYYIRTAHELAGLAAIVNGTAVDWDGVDVPKHDFDGETIYMMNDIDLERYGTYEYWNDEKGWVPIGRAYETDFRGTFDGSGNVAGQTHKLTGLYINDNSLSRAGLFGHIYGGTVKNLSVEDAYINGYNYVGGIVGYAESSALIDECYVTGIVRGGGSEVGGIVGGLGSSSTVQNSYTMADVTSRSYAGGIVGYMTSASKVLNTYATGRVEATGNDPSNMYAGGIAGYAASGTEIKDSMALNIAVLTSGTNADNIGRVVGGGNNQSLSGNKAFEGMRLGYRSGGNTPKTPTDIGHDKSDGENVSKLELRAEDAYEFLMVVPSVIWTWAVADLPGLFGQTVRMPAHLRITPTGTPDIQWYIDANRQNGDNYEIWTADELAGLAWIVNGYYYITMGGGGVEVSISETGTSRFNFAGKTILMMDHIDLEPYGISDPTWNGGNGWLPISDSYYTNSTTRFRGTFNGRGKEIEGLSTQYFGYRGVFGYIQTGTVKNLGVVNANVNSAGSSGGIVGRVDGGTIENCYTTGTITGSGSGSSGYSIGGIVGYAGADISVTNGPPATVKNSYSLADIIAVEYAGGIVGNAGAVIITGNYSTGSVRTTTSGSMSARAGGIVGTIGSEGVVSGNIALNENVLIHPNYNTALGRVAGDYFPASTLSGNAGFKGMDIRYNVPTNWEGGFTKNVSADKVHNGRDGEDRSKASVHVASGFPSVMRPGNIDGWTYKEGDLPGLFGRTVKMPEWLEYNIDASVSVSLNTFPWSGSTGEIETSKSFSLVDNPSGAVVPLTMSVLGTFVGMVDEGEWRVYDGDVSDSAAYTGVDIDVTTTPPNRADVEYYTVNFSVAWDPTSKATGASIKAEYRGNEIKSGAIVAGGDELLFTAIPQGPIGIVYRYFWTVGTDPPVEGHESGMYSIPEVNEAVEVSCLVTGDEAAGEYAIVKVNKDGTAWKTLDVELRNASLAEPIKLTYVDDYDFDDGSGELPVNGYISSAEIQAGVYDIYVEGKNTGRILRVGGSTGPLTLAYWTLTVDGSDDGVSDIGIVADTIKDEYAFFAGEKAGIWAIVEDAYDFAGWTVTTGNATVEDDGDTNTVVTMGNQAAVVKANAVPTNHHASVTVTRNSAAWDGLGVSIRLRDEDIGSPVGPVIALVEDGTTGVYETENPVAPGEYYIYIDADGPGSGAAVVTGEFLTVAYGEPNARTLDYFTLTLQAGEGVDEVVIDSASIYTDATYVVKVFLEGAEVKIRAVPEFGFGFDEWASAPAGFDDFINGTSASDASAEILMPAAPLVLTTSATEYTYEVLVGVTIDNDRWEDLTVEITPDDTDDTAYLLLTESAPGVYKRDDVPVGRYRIYIGRGIGQRAYTGDGDIIEITHPDGTDEATALEYWSLAVKPDTPSNGIKSVEIGSPSIMDRDAFRVGDDVIVKADVELGWTFDGWELTVGSSATTIDDASLESTMVKMAAEQAEVTAAATEDGYIVEVGVNLNRGSGDGGPWSGLDGVSIMLTDGTYPDDRILLTETGIDTGEYKSADYVAPGLYEVYVDHINIATPVATGVIIEVGLENANRAMLDYYMVTFYAIPQGLGPEFHPTMTATYYMGSSSGTVPLFGVVQGGVRLVFEVDENDTYFDHYQFFWNIGPIGGSHNDKVQVVDPVNSEVFVACQVLGTNDFNPASVKATINGSGNEAEGLNIDLYSEGRFVTRMTDEYGGNYSSMVANDTYNIYVSGVDTGKTIMVGAGDPPTVLDFWTLTLAAGEGIASATATGAFLEAVGDGGGTYLYFEGDVADVSAVPENGYSFKEWEPHYLVDISNPNMENTTVTMPSSPGAPVIVDATATLDKYTVDVAVKLDGVAWTGLDVYLFGIHTAAGYVMEPVNDPPTPGLYRSDGDAIPDEYRISIHGDDGHSTDTGRTVKVGYGELNAAALDYWMLTLDGSGTGVESVEISTHSIRNVTTANTVAKAFLTGTSGIEIAAEMNDEYNFARWNPDPSTFNGIANPTARETTVNIGGAPVSIAATSTQKTYEAAVHLWLNERMNGYSGQTVELTADGGTTRYTMTDRGGGQYLRSGLHAGTYAIYVNNENTGRSLAVNHTNPPTDHMEIYYYSLTVERGEGIKSVTGSGAYLEGETGIPISAVPEDGYKFALWTVWESTGGAVVHNVNAASTTVTIGTHKSTVEAYGAPAMHPAVVAVNRDDAPWQSLTVALLPPGGDPETDLIGLREGMPGAYSTVADISEGTYDIYVNRSGGSLENAFPTGETITVDDRYVSEELLEYYTLNLVRGTGIDSVSGGDVYFAGDTVDIDAVVADGCEWTGWTAVPSGFGNVAAKETSITMPKYRLTLTATAKFTPYPASVQLNLDGTGWTGRQVDLTRLSGGIVGAAYTTAEDSGSPGLYITTIPVEPGEFAIFVHRDGIGTGDMYTGRTVKVGYGEPNLETLDYFMLTLDGSDPGIESVEMPMDSPHTVESQDSVARAILKDASVDISATVVDGYDWIEWEADPSMFGNIAWQEMSIDMPNYPLELTARTYGEGFFIVSGGDEGTDYEFDEEPGADGGVVEVLTILTANHDYSISTGMNSPGYETGRIVVSDGLTGVDIELDNVEIVNPPFMASAFNIAGAEVNLTLVGDNVLTAGDGFAGLQVPVGATLAIDGTGTLTANGSGFGAGIGGGVTGGVGTITISGGTVTATGSHYAAGIGGGAGSNNGEIIIEGGTVTATGGSGGTGIGGGNVGMGGRIIIRGDASVVAHGGPSAAAIGGGNQAAGGSIEISGEAEVVAHGGNFSAGIGGGRNGAGGTITIESGTVTATAGVYGTGIGGGEYAHGGMITIEGGKVVAIGGDKGSGDKPGLAMGNGVDGRGGSVTVNGVFAHLENKAANERPIGVPTVSTFSNNSSAFSPNEEYLYIELDEREAYTATVNVSKDVEPWDGDSKSFTLRQVGSDNMPLTLTGGVDSGEFTARVGAGEWTVYDGTVSTGVTIGIIDGDAEAELDYWTLTLAESPGIGSVSGGGVYFEGQEGIAISATVASEWRWSKWTAEPTTFGDVSERNTTITMPDYALKLTATATEDKYGVEVTVRLGSGSHTDPYIGLRAELREILDGPDRGRVVAELEDINDVGVYTAPSVPAGEFAIFIDKTGGIYTEDTGRTIVVGYELENDAVLDYYTVEFAWVKHEDAQDINLDGSTARYRNEGVIAVDDFTELNSGDTVLEGGSIVFRAMPIGDDFDYFTYTWIDDDDYGTAGLNLYVIRSVRGPVNVTCEVYGMSGALTTWEATLNVNLLGSPWDGERGGGLGTVEFSLLLNGIGDDPLDRMELEMGDRGKFSARVVNGVWHVLADGVDTDVVIVINDDDNDTEELNYWMLNATEGAGIVPNSATGIGPHFEGEKVEINAEVLPNHTWSKWVAEGLPAFHDVEDQKAIIDMPDFSVTLRATATEDTYKASVTLTLDGGAWRGQAAAIVPDSGTYLDDAIPLPDIGNTGVYVADGVEIGDYDIYINGVDTSKSIKVEHPPAGGDVAMTLDYFMLTLTAGTGISTYNINTDSVYIDADADKYAKAFLADTEVGITATVEPNYTWAGWDVPDGFTDIDNADNPTTTVTMPAEALGIRATATETTYDVEVTVTQDGNPRVWLAVTIVPDTDGGRELPLAETTPGSSGVYTRGNVPVGNYAIYIDGVDTGESIIVSHGVDPATKTLEYFTLALTAGTGVNAVSGGGAYFAGQTGIEISASGVAAAYTWAGWNVTSGDATVANPALMTTTVTMPSSGESVAITATATLTPQLAEVRLWNDGNPWTGRTVGLVPVGGLLLEPLDEDAAGVYKNATVPPGEYQIWVDRDTPGTTVYTGVDIVIGHGLDNNAELRYSTLEVEAGEGTTLTGYARTVLVGSTVLVAIEPAEVEPGYNWARWTPTPPTFDGFNEPYTALYMRTYITMPDYALKLTATATLTPYPVTVNFNIDGGGWAGLTTVELREIIDTDEYGDVVATLVEGVHGVYETPTGVLVAPGEYAIFVEREDWGFTVPTTRNVEVGYGLPNSATLNYWTLEVVAGVGTDVGGDVSRPVLEGVTVFIQVLEVEGGYTWDRWVSDPPGFTGYNTPDTEESMEAYITMPTEKLKLTATAKEDDYTVEVTVRKDDDKWDGLTLELVEILDGGGHGTVVAELDEIDDTGVYTADEVPVGEYAIYIDKTDAGTTEDTHETIVVGYNPNDLPDINAAVLDYYTVEFEWKPDETTPGIDFDGSTVRYRHRNSTDINIFTDLATGDAVLAGGSIVFRVNATSPTYDWFAYTWTDADQGPTAAFVYAIGGISGPVDVVCTVKGLEEPPPTHDVMLKVELNGFEWDGYMTDQSHQVTFELSLNGIGDPVLLEMKERGEFWAEHKVEDGDWHVLADGVDTGVVIKVEDDDNLGEETLSYWSLLIAEDEGIVPGSAMDSVVGTHFVGEMVSITAEVKPGYMWRRWVSGSPELVPDVLDREATIMMPNTVLWLDATTTVIREGGPSEIYQGDVLSMTNELVAELGMTGLDMTANTLDYAVDNDADPQRTVTATGTLERAVVKGMYQEAPDIELDGYFAAFSVEVHEIVPKNASDHVVWFGIGDTPYGYTLAQADLRHDLAEDKYYLDFTYFIEPDVTVPENLVMGFDFDGEGEDWEKTLYTVDFSGVTLLPPPYAMDDVIRYVTASEASVTLDVGAMLEGVVSESGGFVYGASVTKDDDDIISGVPSIPAGVLSVAFDAGKFKVGNTATVTVTVGGFADYLPTSFDFVIKQTDKTPVDLDTGIMSKVYDGFTVYSTRDELTAVDSVTGEAVAIPWDAVDKGMLTYRWLDASGAPLLNSNGEPMVNADAPVNRGRYMVRVVYDTSVGADPDEDMSAYYAGEALHHFVILRRLVTVQAGSGDVKVGEPVPELSVGYTGLADGEHIAFMLGGRYVDPSDPENSDVELAWAEVATVENTNRAGEYPVYFSKPAELNSIVGRGDNYRLEHVGGELIVRHHSTISLTPTNAILEDEAVSVTIEAMFEPDIEDYDKIEWSVERGRSNVSVADSRPQLVKGGVVDGWTEWRAGETGAVLILTRLAEDTVDTEFEGKRAEVKATAAGLAAGETMRVRATYLVSDTLPGGRYTAVSTVELIPALPITTDNTRARVPDPTVVANKARVVAARVPIVLERTPKPDPVRPMGLDGLDDGLGALDEPQELGGARLIDEVVIGTMPTSGANAGIFTRWTPLAANPEAVTARISQTDDRFIEIMVDMGVRNATTKNLVARLRVKGTGENGVPPVYIYTNTFSVQVVERYPTYTYIQSNQLNTRYPDRDTVVTARASDGSRLEILSIVHNNSKAANFVSIQADGKTLRPVGTKAGRPSLRLTVVNHDYKFANKAAKANGNNGNVIVTTAINVVNTMPAVRLDRSSLGFLSPNATTLPPGPHPIRDALGPITINLITSNTRVPFEQGYKVADVVISDVDNRQRAYNSPHRDNVDISYDKATGRITLTPKATMPASNGRLWLAVSYEGMSASLADRTYLAVNFTSRALDKVTVSISPKSYRINNAITPRSNNLDLTGRVGDGTVVAEFAVNMNVANLHITDWTQTVAGRETTKTGTQWLNVAKEQEDYPGGAWNTPGAAPVTLVTPRDSMGWPMPNRIRVVANADEMMRLTRHPVNGNPDSRNKTYSLTVGTAGLLSNISRATPRTFALGLTFSGAQPNFSISLGKGNIDVSLEDSFRPATVRLTDTSSPVREVRLYNTAEDATRAVQSHDFETVMTGPNTFNIKMREGRFGYVRPKLAQRLSVEVILENGQILKSWGVNAKNGRPTDKTISINPASAVPRANPTRLADVSMYRDQPLQGAKLTTLGFDGTRAPIGAEIGYVQIQASGIRGFEDGGFRLEQNGEGEWTIHFMNDDRPYIVATSGNNAGNRTYTRAGDLTPLKSSYTLRIEMWPKGTYQLYPEGHEHAGQPMLVQAGQDKNWRVQPHMNNASKPKATTKPTVINQRVFVR